MIIDRLENYQQYRGLNERLCRALRYLRMTDCSALELGEHCIEGRDILAIVNEYPLKPASEGRLEAHRNYIDIQYLVTNAETMGYAPLLNQPELTDYDVQRDLIFYAGEASPVLVQEGMFAIFYPQDLHMPGLGDPCVSVRKIVMKVRV